MIMYTNTTLFLLRKTLYTLIMYFLSDVREANTLVPLFEFPAAYLLSCVALRQSLPERKKAFSNILKLSQ